MKCSLFSKLIRHCRHFFILMLSPSLVLLSCTGPNPDFQPNFQPGDIGTVPNAPPILPTFLQPSFGPRMDFAFSENSDSAAVSADINEDGKDDLLFAINTWDFENTTYIAKLCPFFYDESSHSFQPGTEIPLQEGIPRSIIAKDFDEDGHIDLVFLIDFHIKGIQFFKGDGLGHFSFWKKLTLTGYAQIFKLSSGIMTGNSPESLNDIWMLASKNQISDPENAFVARIPFLGKGEFGVAETRFVENDAYKMAIADINQDGLPDAILIPILWNGGSPYLNILMQDQTKPGTWLTPQKLMLPFSCRSIALGDVDEDGHVDLVVTGDDGTTTSLFIFQGDGQGGFNTQKPWFVYPFENHPWEETVLLSDLNQDKHLDLLLTDNYYRSKQGQLILWGQGKEGFTKSQAFPIQGPAVGGTGAANLWVLGDFNGDNKLDLALHNDGLRVAYFFLGQENSFAEPQVLATEKDKEAPGLLLSGDFDQNGSQDIVIFDKKSPYVFSYFGYQHELTHPSWWLGDWWTWAYQTGVSNTVVTQGDLSNSNLPAIAVLGIDQGKPKLNVLEGIFKKDQGHRFQIRQQIELSTPQFTDITLSHLGKAPAEIIFSQNDPSLAPLWILHEQSDGFFGTPTPLVLEGINQPTALTREDLNQDGIDELLVSTQSDAALHILKRKLTTLEFVSSYVWLLPTGSEPGKPIAIDMNKDGTKDVIVSLKGKNQIALALSKGDNLVEIPFLTTEDVPLQVLAVDINADSLPDVIVRLPTSIQFFLNQGNGVFQTQKTIPLGDKPYSLVVQDVDHDGLVDFVLSFPDSGTMRVLYQQKPTTLL